MTSVRWLVFAVVFALGEAAAFAFPGGGFLWPHLAVLGLVAVSLAFGFRCGRWPELALFLTGAVLALAACDRRTGLILETIDGPEHGRYEAELRVASSPRVTSREDGTGRAAFFARSGDLRLYVTVPVASAADLPRIGGRLRVRGRLSRPRSGSFSETLSLWACGEGDGIVAVPRSWTDAVREDLSRRMGIGLDPGDECADIDRAILLGERGRLSDGARTLFSEAGTVHIFAISGVHVMIVSGLLWLLFMPVLPYRACSVAVPAVLWAYIAVVGFPPSAVRAALMVTHCMFAAVCWRRPDTLVAWSLAFILVNAASPATLFDLGALFSFTVMLVIVLWVRVAKGYFRGVTSMVVFALVAWAAGVPIAAHVFARIAPAAPIANLLLIPVATWNVLFSSLGLLSSFVSDWLAAHFNNFAAMAAKLMVGVSAAVTGTPGGSVAIVAWSWSMCLEWYAALGLIIWYVYLRRRNASTRAILPGSACLRRKS